MSTTALQVQQPRTMDKFKSALNAMKDQIALALPKGVNVDRAISSVLITVANSEKLQKCTPKSICTAVVEAATLALPVNSLGLAYLVPYNVKKKTQDPDNPKRTIEYWEDEAKLQIGYRGYIQLVCQHGYVVSIDAEVVHEKDEFRTTYGTNRDIHHVPFLNGDPGKIIAAYAVATLHNGSTKFIVMTYSQLMEVKKRSKSANYGPWVTDESEMLKKTAVKRLSKLLPLGPVAFAQIAQAEDIDAEAEQSLAFPAYQQPGQSLPPAPAPISHAANFEAGADEPPHDEHGEVIDAEVEPETEPVAEAPAAPVNVKETLEQQKILGQIRDIHNSALELDKKFSPLPDGLDSKPAAELAPILADLKARYKRIQGK